MSFRYRHSNPIIFCSIIVIAYVSWCFGIKSEVFECDVAKDTCQIVVTNNLGHVKYKSMPSPRLYKDIKIQHTRMLKSSRRGSSTHVDVYYLYYTLLDGKKGRLFERDFHSESAAEGTVNEIKQAFRTKNGHIRYEL